MLEIDVNDVIAADRPGQRNVDAENINAGQPGNLARLWFQAQSDPLEVLDLFSQAEQFVECFF